MLRRLVLLGSAAIAAGAAAPAPASATTLSCSRTVIEEILRAQVPAYAVVADNFGGLAQTRCVDVTGDGAPDVLYTLDSGGTGRAFDWGLIVAAGPAARVATAGRGYKLAIDIRGDRPEVAQPVYRSGDPNCCPTGGAVLRVYTWNGRRLALATTRRIRAVPSRFFG